MNSGDGSARGAMTGKRVAVLGYGDQARQHAIALRAAGNTVTVVVRPGGMSWTRAIADGFRPRTVAEAVRDADVVAMLVPDVEQAALYSVYVAPSLEPGALVVFARGGPVAAGAIEPAPGIDVVLVKSRGGECLVAVHQDGTGEACTRAAAYARSALGHAARAVATTTFEREMAIDLQEEAVQCGGVDKLIDACEREIDRAGHEPNEAALAYYDRLRTAVSESRTQLAASPSRPPVSTALPFTTKQRGVA
jgi:ketol-acid reductoisomerase